MRRILFATAGLFAALSWPGQILAAGNVLLPSDSSSSNSSLPNLGLGGSSASPSAPTTAPAATTPPPAASTTPSTTAANPLTTAAGSNAATLLSTGGTGHKMTIDDIITPVNQETAKHLAPGQIPTQVVHMPDTTALMAGYYKDLPESLTIAISNKSFFGSQDVQTIGTKLGISRDQIGSSCLLTVRGMLMTDKSGYILESGANPQVNVRYDGAIKNYMMAAYAMCLTPQNLPPGSGMLQETGGRIGVTLQQIVCNPPTRQAQSLTITYDGTNPAQCAYN